MSTDPRPPDDTSGHAAQPRRASSVAVTGPILIRLRGVRVEGAPGELNIDVTAGELHVLDADEPVASELLRVLAGQADAVTGSAETATEEIDLAAPGHEKVLDLYDVVALADGLAPDSPVIGLVDPWNDLGTDRVATTRATETLLYLSVIEGRTILASGRPNRPLAS